MTTEANQKSMIPTAINNAIPAAQKLKDQEKSLVLPGIKSVVLDQSDSYFGGKGSDGTYQKIINQIPKHEIFIETHAGHAKITENLGEFDGVTVLNDIDPQVCKYLRIKFKDKLIDKRYFQQTYAPYQVKKFFDASHGKVVIENEDAIDLLRKYREIIGTYKTVIFCDPPYPMKSRKSQECRYNFEMSDKQHEELISYLDLFDAPAMICTYPNEIYERNLSKWRRIDYESNTRHGMAKEHLYLNFGAVLELRTIKYFGNDYREREKYKKILANLKRKLKSLPEPILNSIIEDFIK